LVTFQLKENAISAFLRALKNIKHLSKKGLDLAGQEAGKVVRKG